MMNMHRKISLRLDSDLAERLQMRADRERVPVSHLLRHLILRLLGELQQPETAPSSSPSPSWRKESAAALKTRSEQLRDEFRAEVCSMFDNLVKQGCDSKEATKRINFTLKVRKHPWATYEVISSVIRKTGRFRKSGKVIA